MTGEAGSRPTFRRRWLPTRIRSKLIFLHTAFSLGLAIALLVALRPPLREMMYEAERAEAFLTLELHRASPDAPRRGSLGEVRVEAGPAEAFGIDEASARRARETGEPVVVSRDGSGPLVAAAWDESRGQFLVASVRMTEARAALNRLYLLLTLALLAVYGLIALTIEVFVLPRQVYEPIETLRRADEAVQEGRRESEIIPEESIPADELGEIMRSRNLAVMKLREQEEALASALQRIEAIANELKRKNHLLETARRNLADQDRLASLGMMSAGIAHELNTPLAVLKGCMEELGASNGGLAEGRLALMKRTVSRLERLSESLLDFARARPAAADAVPIRAVLDEAWTLVNLDRSAAGVSITIDVPADCTVTGDGDRLTQVLVNILRNAVDAMEGKGSIVVSAEETEREGRGWVSLTVADTGPGIDPAVLPKLFEPFQSTRLDAHGTGLGLAVADGIVREHGGLILARNRPEGGAVFEVMLPKEGAAAERGRVMG